MKLTQIRTPREAGQASSLILAQVALILVAAGIFAAIFGPGRIIYCQRVDENNVNCTITQTFFGIGMKTTEVVGVLAANLDQRCEGVDCAYALQMYGNNGFVQIDDDYVRDLTVRQAIADRINEFLQKSDGQEITLKDRVKPGAYIGAGVVFAALFGMLGFSLWQARRQDN